MSAESWFWLLVILIGIGGVVGMLLKIFRKL